MPYKRQSPYASSINENLPRDEIRNKIHDYVKGLIDNNSNCLNWNNGRPTSCSCIKKFREDDCFDQLLEKLDKFERKDSEGRKLFLHGVLTHGNLKKGELRRGEKRSCLYALTAVECNNQDTIFVCNNTLRNFFFIGIKQWRCLQKDAMLPDPKSTERYERNINRATKCTQRL